MHIDVVQYQVKLLRLWSRESSLSGVKVSARGDMRLNGGESSRACNIRFPSVFLFKHSLSFIHSNPIAEYKCFFCVMCGLRWLYCTDYYSISQIAAKHLPHCVSVSFRYLLLSKTGDRFFVFLHRYTGKIYSSVELCQRWCLLVLLCLLCVLVYRHGIFFWCFLLFAPLSSCAASFEIHLLLLYQMQLWSLSYCTKKMLIVKISGHFSINKIIRPSALL